MSTELFTVKEHALPGSHVREYASITKDGKDHILELAVKQYTPKRQPSPLPANAVTILACHASGFPKELYEPLWDEILRRSESNGFSVRGIWIADNANHGQSGILNEHKLSIDYSWSDHARDLLLLVNHFRAEMPRPIIGVGHSFGGMQIVDFALLHPRLMTSVILLDPVIQLNPPALGLGTDPPGGANFAVHKDDVFPSRDAAAVLIAKSPMFRGWNPRVQKLMVEHGFRELPTALHPETPVESAKPVTFTTTKHQETVTVIRENFRARDTKGKIRIDRRTHADMDPLAAFIPFYRSEPRSTFYRLPVLRPSALWLLPPKSFLSVDEMREGIKAAGTGVGGSGGILEGEVKEEVLPRGSHLYPFEEPGLAADRIAAWLRSAVKSFQDEEQAWQKDREQLGPRGDLELSDQWRKLIKPLSHWRRSPTASPAKPSKL